MSSSQSNSDDDNYYFEDSIYCYYPKNEYITYKYTFPKHIDTTDYKDGIIETLDCIYNPIDDFNIASISKDKDLIFKITDEIINLLYNKPNILKFIDKSLTPTGTIINYLYEYGIYIDNKYYDIDIHGRYAFCYDTNEHTKCNYKCLQDPQIGDHYYSFVVLDSKFNVFMFAAW